MLTAVILVCIILLATYPLAMSSKIRKVHVSYPTELLAPVVSTFFQGTVHQNRLTCFSNRDYSPPTYLNTFLCMIRYHDTLGAACNSLWGSRPVVIEVNGSVEFLKVNKLPHESNMRIDIHATRWLELNSASSSIHSNVGEHIRDIKQIPCEPVYLCARSNDWNGKESHFQINFRPGYVRFKDKDSVFSKYQLHLLLLFMLSSVRLLPYVAAFFVATLSYKYAISYIVLITLFSIFVGCLTPFMLTKKNRHFALHYIKYFFTRLHAQETKDIIRKRLIVFQAVYFSSVLVCIGTATAHILYSYCGFDRNVRNTIIQASVGIAASWLTFSLCRSFERFCRDWSWVAMCIGLVQILETHLNPYSREEMFVVVLLITFICKAIISRVMMKYDWAKLLYVPYSQSKTLYSSFKTVLKRKPSIPTKDLSLVDVYSPTDASVAHVLSGFMPNPVAVQSSSSLHSYIPNRPSSRSSNPKNLEDFEGHRSRSSSVQVESDGLAPVAQIAPVEVPESSENNVDVGYHIEEFNGLIADQEDDTRNEEDEEADEDEDGVMDDEALDELVSEIMNETEDDEEGLSQRSKDSRPFSHTGSTTKIPFQESDHHSIHQSVGSFLVDGTLYEKVKFSSNNPGLIDRVRSALDSCSHGFQSSFQPPLNDNIVMDLELEFHSFVRANNLGGFFSRLYNQHGSLPRRVWDDVVIYVQSAIQIQLNCLFGPADSYPDLVFSLKYNVVGQRVIVSMTVTNDYFNYCAWMVHSIGRQVLQSLFHAMCVSPASINGHRFPLSFRDLKSYDVHSKTNALKDSAFLSIIFCESSISMAGILKKFQGFDHNLSLIKRHVLQFVRSQDRERGLTTPVGIDHRNVEEIAKGVLSALDISLPQSTLHLRPSLDIDIISNEQGNIRDINVDDAHVDHPEDADPLSDMLNMNFLEDVAHENEAAENIDRFVWQLRMPIVFPLNADAQSNANRTSLDAAKIIGSLVLAQVIYENAR